jgi:4-alpha-glucanotransferase
MDDIADQASVRGIETEYIDANGALQVAAAGTIARLIEAIPADRAREGRIYPPTIVLRRGSALRIRPSRRWRGAVRWEIFGEDRAASGEGATPLITLPRDLPTGSFELRISFSSPSRETENVTVLVASKQAYQGHDRDSRVWALAVQLYGVRSRRNWGHGDFTDLLGLIDLASECGAAGIGLNPLHDTLEASPYSPNSRLFLNPLYVDVEAIPGFPGVPAEAEQEIEVLRGRTLIDYPDVRSVKLRGLTLAYEAFDTKLAPVEKRDFARFCAERSPTLQRFACFEVLRGRFGSPWREWPDSWRTPNDEHLDRLRRDEADRIGFFEFVQWQADRQLRACRDRARHAGMTLGLYLDVAVGVQPDGFDAWDNQAIMLPDVAVGAPPDSLNTAGQNWGLAALNPLALESSRFALFRDILKSTMRYAGAVRLDHVLGLKRLYLVPNGVAAGQGAYVRFPFEPLLAVVAQESIANQCVVIGEDLGTVPENFRETLAAWGIWSYRVMLFERDMNGDFLPPESYSRNALATFTTHDLPTFSGWAEGHDLAVKAELGINPGETSEERKKSRLALAEALTKRGQQSFEFSSVARYLADTPARLLMISMEDVLEIKQQVNLPGTINEYPNWRLRLPVLMENLRNEIGLVNLATAMRMAGRGTDGAGLQV